MLIPFKVGMDNPKEEDRFIHALGLAQDEKLEQQSAHVVNAGAVPRQDAIFDANDHAQLAPEYRAILTPAYITVVPGAITWFPSAPYPYQRITPGAALCWARNQQQSIDASNGKIFLRACSDAANSTTDNAYAQLGSIVTLAAQQRAELIYSWTASVRLDWDLKDAGDWVNLGIGIGWEVWSWNNSIGQKVRLENFGSTFGNTWSPLGSSWGLKGTRNLNLVPSGQSCLLSRAALAPTAQETTYCVLLDVWLQVNSGGGAIELDLRLNQPA